MERVTFVIEFEEGKVQPIKANMEAFGGKVVTVRFGDALAEDEEDTPVKLPLFVIPPEMPISETFDIGKCNYVAGWNACHQEAVTLGGVPSIIKGVDEFGRGWNTCRETILFLSKLEKPKSSREEFEEFMRTETNHSLERTEFPFTTYENQQYANHITNMAWIAWQAARNNK